MAYVANGGRTAWSTRFPVYQIDFTAVASGKRVATSKRRIRWRFGFSNQEALDAGESGIDCRGEEHDVTVVWSVTSGKRLILADGQEVHYSTARSGTFEFSWTMKGNHVLKVVCQATPPVSNNSNFRQYDLSVDGQSFFMMPKVYELGIRGPINSHAPVPGVVSSRNAVSNKDSGYYDSGRYNDNSYSNNPSSTREQEEEDLKRAIQNSIEESRQHLRRTTEQPESTTPSFATAPAPKPAPAPAPAPAVDLLDFGAMTISNNPTQPYQQYAPQSQATAPVPAPAPVQPPTAQSYAGTQSYNSGQYQTTTSAPPPSFSDIYMSTQPQASYEQVKPANYPAPNNAGLQHQISDITTTTNQTNTYAVPPAPVQAPAPAAPGTPGTMVRKLVNMDNINAPVSSGTQLANVFSDKNTKGAASNGPQPSLQEMQLAKPNNNKQVVLQSGYNQAVTPYNNYQGAMTQAQPSAYNQYQTQGAQQTQVAAYNGQQQNQYAQQYPPQQLQQYSNYGGYSQQQQRPSY